MLADYQEAKEARLEASGQEDDDEEDMDAVRAGFYARIPNTFLYKLLRDRLSENDCRNRGYLLEGFPRNFQDAQYVFLQRKKKWDEDNNEWVEVEDEDDDVIEDADEEADPPLKNFKNYEPDKTIFPSHVLLIEGSDDMLKKKMRDLDENSLTGTHYTEADMKRRL